MSIPVLVQPELYRSSLLSRTPAKAKTILLLSSEPMKSSLDIIDLPGKLTDDLIKEGLQIILNYDLYPLVIMCANGIYETAALVGCLRKMQKWNFNSVIVEYRSFAGAKAKYQVELFIELFDTDLVVLPKNLPPWFKS